ncbi:GNAT family N-acetyltransferase [Acidaminobacter sp. JC074]|uniref:GNAT family N-acetyltransferase n=1 Tax=Acidaminobacter sp. JC074 TaxID=2530199 RepID=UPI001F114DE4|nr:GNAT family N-acetyltransferase [Acidaminobacter sp. JC074]MCH4891383.1 GNAT family N-acetyltransferase [Acidaminobacter sp. JC074]
MIRTFEKSDLSSCIEVHRASFKEAPWFEQWNYEDSMARLVDIQNTPRFYGLVYCNKDQIIGALFGHVEQMNGFQIFFIKEMFVKAGDKNKGVGGKLIRALERHLCECKIEHVQLFTSKKHGIDRFYLKQGYAIDNDFVLLEKRINENNN